MTYLNYNSEAKVAYYQVLLSKLPKLRSRKFCLKKTLHDQSEALQRVAVQRQRIAEVQAELSEHAATKEQLRRFIQVMRAQLHQMHEDKSRLQLNYNEVAMREKCEERLGDLESKYAREERLDAALVREVMRCLEEYE